MTNEEGPKPPKGIPVSEAKIAELVEYMGKQIEGVLRGDLDQHEFAINTLKQQVENLTQRVFDIEDRRRRKALLKQQAKCRQYGRCPHCGKG